MNNKFQEFNKDSDFQLYSYLLLAEPIPKLELVKQYFALKIKNNPQLTDLIKDSVFTKPERRSGVTVFKGASKEQLNKATRARIIESVPLEELNALMFKAYHAFNTPTDSEKYDLFNEAFMELAEQLVREAYQYERDQHNKLFLKLNTFGASIEISLIVSLVPCVFLGIPLIAAMPLALIAPVSLPILSLVVALTFIVSMIVSYRFFRSTARAQFVFDALPQSAVTTLNEEAKVTPFSKTGELRKVKYTDSNDDEWLIGTKPQIARARAQSLLFNKYIAGVSEPKKTEPNVQLVGAFRQFRTRTKRQSVFLMREVLRRITGNKEEPKLPEVYADDPSSNFVRLSIKRRYEYLFAVPKVPQKENELFKPNNALEEKMMNELAQLSK